MTFFQRLFQEVTFERGGHCCWIWQNGTDSNGYGKIKCEGRKIRPVHVVVYEMYRGKIPPGFVLDHLCRNRRCCNPWECQIVTGKVNTQRGARHNDVSGIQSSEQTATA